MALCPVTRTRRAPADASASASYRGHLSARCRHRGARARCLHVERGSLPGTVRPAGATSPRCTSSAMHPPRAGHRLLLHGRRDNTYRCAVGRHLRTVRRVLSAARIHRRSQGSKSSPKFRFGVGVLQNWCWCPCNCRPCAASSAGLIRSAVKRSSKRRRHQ